MSTQNTKRLIQNSILLLIVIALVFFIATRKQEQGKTYATLYDKAIGDNANEIVIHFEENDDVILKNSKGIWKVVKPEEFIADKRRVQQLFTLLSENAESSYDLKDKDLARYGLDKERLSISFNGVKYIFGKLNPVARKRFIRKGDKMYLVDETVSGLMQMGVEGFRPQPLPELKPATEE